MLKFTVMSTKNRVDLLSNSYTDTFYYKLRDALKVVGNLECDTTVMRAKLDRTAMSYELEETNNKLRKEYVTNHDFDIL